MAEEAVTESDLLLENIIKTAQKKIRKAFPAMERAVTKDGGDSTTLSLSINMKPAADDTLDVNIGATESIPQAKTKLKGRMEGKQLVMADAIQDPPE